MDLTTTLSCYGTYHKKLWTSNIKSCMLIGIKLFYYNTNTTFFWTMNNITVSVFILLFMLSNVLYGNSGVLSNGFFFVHAFLKQFIKWRITTDSNTQLPACEPSSIDCSTTSECYSCSKDEFIVKHTHYSMLLMYLLFAFLIEKIVHQ